MFRAVHTPIIRSTGLTVSTVIGTIIGQAQIVSGTASQCKCYRFVNVINANKSALFGDCNFNFYGATRYMNFTGSNL